MRSIKILERLQQIHQLIRIENTGTPKQMASSMRISERSIHLLLEQLKDYNALIRYSRSRKTYYYENDFELEISISVKVMNDKEITQVFGGSYFTKSKLNIAS